MPVFKRSFLSVVVVVVSTLMLEGCIITGKVTDQNGDGIEGVTVTLSGDANLTTITNSKGGYIFGNFFDFLIGQKPDQLTLIMPGSYTVTPFKTGYDFIPNSTGVSVTEECYGPSAVDLSWPVGGVNFEAIALNTEPVPGDWTGSPAFGGLEFTVNSTSTGISEIIYIFSDFQCGGLTLYGLILTVRKQTGEGLCPISNQQFTITSSLGPLLEVDLQITISGTFDATGTHVSGSWETASYGTTCSGTWNGSAD